MAELFDLIECKNKDEWVAWRRKGVGSSDVAAVIGASPWKSALDLWAEKVGLLEPPAAESEAMKWGRLLEDPIAHAYEEETRRVTVSLSPWTILRSRQYPFLLATPDREIAPIDGKDGPGILEIKTASAFKAEEWKDEVPLAYQVQWQHQAFVKGAAWGSLAVLLGGQRFLWKDIDRDEVTFRDAVLPRLEEFWALVELEQPPPVTADEGVKELLFQLYPKDSGASVALPIEAMTWTQEIEDAEAGLKPLEESIRLNKNRLRAAIGEATFGVLPNGDRWSLKRIEKHIEAKAAYTQEYRELRRLKGKAK